MGRTLRYRRFLVLILAALTAITAALFYAIGLPGSQQQTDDDAFWSALRLDGDEVESYSSFTTMSEKSDLVVRGMIGDDIDLRTIQGDAPEDQIFMAVLSISDESNRAEGPALVEFLLPAVDKESAEHTAHHLRESLPQEPIVAFLRLKKGEGDGKIPRYRLVSSDGIWIETPDGLHNPLSESSGRSFGPDQKLDDLVD